MTDALILKGLKTGDTSVLKSVYLNNKDAFIAFAKTYGLNKNDALDIYQDSILALRENVATGRLVELKSSLKTYLFSIGKYMIFDFLRAKKRMVPVETKDLKLAELPEGFEILFKEEINSKELKLNHAFEQLGEKCKAVLTLFYYKGYSIEEITKLLKYSSKDVVKSQKSRCLKTLKEKINNGK
ncbi:RNA polymerase sigma factor [Winogradskyella sp. PG-2]|uniref:RNA polymerase sigma factor n=1 Tax=Winogradskyella sp. PG-2 TaxID=754409 RepID=UPI0004586ACC|nr:RNA polymerase sigma factor [Winogradskyella sp. PG-2]BAO75259.1 hypothetical protein WPG_1029 [Winogradskyella sp. PG-2]